MKRMLPLVLLLCSMVGSLAAQEVDPEKESSYFVKTLTVVRVFPHHQGFVVRYATSSGDVATTYLPLRWFNEPAGRAEIIYGHDASYPYLQVYWNDGEFSHVRLFVRESYDDPTWGAIRGTPDLAANFDVDAPELRF